MLRPAPGWGDAMRAAMAAVLPAPVESATHVAVAGTRVSMIAAVAATVALAVALVLGDRCCRSVVQTSARTRYRHSAADAYKPLDSDACPDQPLVRNTHGYLVCAVLAAPVLALTSYFFGPACWFLAAHFQIVICVAELVFMATAPNLLPLSRYWRRTYTHTAWSSTTSIARAIHAAGRDTVNALLRTVTCDGVIKTVGGVARRFAGYIPTPTRCFTTAGATSASRASLSSSSLTRGLGTQDPLNCPTPTSCVASGLSLLAHIYATVVHWVRAAVMVARACWARAFAMTPLALHEAQPRPSMP